MNKKRLFFVYFFCLTPSFLFSIFIAFSSISSECSPPTKSKSIELKDDLAEDEHKLAVVVPFRDRFEELLVFVPHLSKFLKQQGIKFKIFVINQVDKHRFNRGSLINVGYLLSHNECDYLAMHDVDLLPLNPELDYGFPEAGPFHLAAPHLHPKYHYSTFVGGILLLNRMHFQKVNGLSNKYWGWGLEDDEFYARMKEAKLKVNRPSGLSTNSTNTFRHLHGVRKRDTVRLFNQKEATRRRDRVTGLSSVKYFLEGWHQLIIDQSSSCYVYNVHLECDYHLTPWCDHTSPKKTLRK